MRRSGANQRDAARCGGRARNSREPAVPAGAPGRSGGSATAVLHLIDCFFSIHVECIDAGLVVALLELPPCNACNRRARSSRWTPAGAVLLSGWVMFHMGDDVKILAVATVGVEPRCSSASFWPRHRPAPGLLRESSSAALAAGDLLTRRGRAGQLGSFGSHLVQRDGIRSLAALRRQARAGRLERP